MKYSVDSINILNYYDYILAAWIRVNGTYYYVETEQSYTEQDDEPIKYIIYAVTDRTIKKYKLLETRLFRHMVGWHNLRLAPNFERFCYFSSKYKPGWSDYYKIEKSISLKPYRVKIGTSTDYLKTVDIDENCLDML